MVCDEGVPFLEPNTHTHTHTHTHAHTHAHPVQKNTEVFLVAGKEVGLKVNAETISIL